MIEENIEFYEKSCTGSSPTKNEIFDKNGYLILRNLCDVSKFNKEVPSNRGQLYYNNKELVKTHEIDDQVNGALSRYNHPEYRDLFLIFKEKIESIIGESLYPTYYFDRFYFLGHELKKHVDRNACEISLTVCLDYNCGYQWPLFVKSPNGEVSAILMNPGDAVLYKGCERPHWRNPLEDKRNLKSKFKNFFNTDIVYHHQIFFHYVLANGIRAHFAFDRR